MYKYHFSIDEVMDLTVPQLMLFEKELVKFIKAENGVKDEDRGKNVDANRLAFGATAKMLKEKTGKDKISLRDVMQPEQALKKAKK